MAGFQHGLPRTSRTCPRQSGVHGGGRRTIRLLGLRGRSATRSVGLAIWELATCSWAHEMTAALTAAGNPAGRHRSVLDTDAGTWQASRNGSANRCAANGSGAAVLRERPIVYVYRHDRNECVPIGSPLC
jgi:hypothetical protein